MRLKLLFAVFWLSLVTACTLHHGSQRESQPSPESPLVASSYPSLEVQAKEVKEAFLRKDYARYADLTYAKSIEASGGKERFVKKLEEDMKEVEARGLKYLSFTLDTPSQIIRDSGSLYAVVPNHLTVKDADSTYRTYDCMIGVSSDNGHNWTFVDVGAFGKNGLSLSLGDVTNKLELPPEKKPVKLSE